jgi:hypothetical protein
MPFLSPGFVDFNDLSKALTRAISEALARADCGEHRQAAGANREATE